MDNVDLQQVSAQLSSAAEHIVAFCGSALPPAAVAAPLRRATALFAASGRTLVRDTLGQPEALATFERWSQGGHAHTKDFPMMNVWDVLFVAFAYLAIVFGGRLLMWPLPAVPSLIMKPIAIVHNLVLTALSAFMVAETLNQAFVVNSYKLIGNDIDSSPRGAGMARIVWIFYASKVLEFIDTFIMVLKKKSRQISFLHLYHHFTIYLIWWAVSRFGANGDAYYCVVLNSFIHVIMYSYYLSTTLGVPLSFIKPFITSMQMLQFLIMLTGATYSVIYPAKNYPYWLFVLLQVYMVTLLFLFGQFFVQNYTKKDGKSKRNSKRKTE